MSFTGKVIFCIVVMLLALTPTWLFLMIHHFANPQGFWQNLALMGLGLWVLGSLQLVLFIFGVAVCISFCDD